MSRAGAYPEPTVPENVIGFVPAGLVDGKTVKTGDTISYKIVGHIAPAS